MKKIIGGVKSEQKNDNSKSYFFGKKNNILSNIGNSDVNNFSFKFSIYFWFFGLIFVYLGFIFFKSLDIIYLILTAFVLSIAMESVIISFPNKLPRIVSIIISYLIVVVFLLSGFILIIPFVIQQTAQIIELFIDKILLFQEALQSKGLINLVEDMNWIPSFVKSVIINNIDDPNAVSSIQNTIQENISNLVSAGTNYLTNFGFWIIQIISSFFSILFKILLVFILSVFFSIEKETVIKLISRVSNNSLFISSKVKKVYIQLGYRLKSQLILCLFVGITVWLLLSSLSFLPWIKIDIPNKFTLALIAGITEFIPMLGPILGAIPALLVAGLTNGFVGVIVVGILYYIVQFFENNVLIPMIMNKTLGVSPLLIFIAMLIGGTVLGFIGILLSVPIAVIISLMLEEKKEI